jgi:GNAT superfamily N-acetyltransferase
MNFSIRKSKIEDAPFLADLSTQLGYPSTFEEMASRLQVIDKLTDHQVCVAVLSNGEIAGWIHVFLAIYLESDPFVEIGGLVVSEKYRNQGIGKRLVEAAEAWTQDRNVGMLRVRTRITRKNTHQFYEGFGFELMKTQHVYRKIINKGGNENG